MTFWKKSALGLLCAGVSLTIAPGCRRSDPSTAAPQYPAVRVVKPAEKEVTEYGYFTGRMDAVESVDVRARVTGYLVEINFKPGQEVKKDDLLFRIDPRPYKAAADEAHSRISLAKAKLGLAKANFNRAKDIAKTPGAISQQEMDTAAAELQQADAELEASTADAESADLNLGFTEITAPIEGIIGRPLLTLGNLITQDSSLLTTIVSQDPMYAYFDVDERSMLMYQQLIREGKVKSARAGEVVPVEVGLANEGNKYPHAGQLDFVNNRVDPLTGTIQVRGMFPNPKPEKGTARTFTPGLFVRVRLPIGTAHPAMVIPQAAIGSDQGRKFVLVVNDQSIVEYRPIKTGPEEAGGTQVVEPLKIVREGNAIRLAGDGEKGEDSLTPKDRVIIGGLQKIRPGDQVTPKDAETASP